MTRTYWTVNLLQYSHKLQRSHELQYGHKAQASPQAERSVKQCTCIHPA